MTNLTFEKQALLATLRVIEANSQVLLIARLHVRMDLYSMRPFVRKSAAQNSNRSTLRVYELV